MQTGSNRRHFLAASAAGAAALAAARRSWAQADAPARKIVVGVMGAGGRGTSLAQQFAQQPGVEVAYVCDPDSRRAEGAAAAVEKATATEKSAGRRAKATGDFRTILDDKTVDVLVIAAPNHWHGPGTILACAAGKHVYVEKPCCHNPREAELMVEAARKFGRVVQVGTQRRSWPRLIEAVEKLRAGAIGRVLVARSWYNNLRGPIGRGKEAPPPEWLDWDLWQGPAPRRPFRDNVVHYNWHWFWHWGNGEIGNNGVHGLDVCRWGLGVDFPIRVSSAGGKYFFDDDQETPDTQLVSYEFAGGKLIAWEGRNWHHRGFEGEGFGVDFYGDNGTLVITDAGYKIFDRRDKELETQTGTGGEAGHIVNFLAAVRGQAQANAAIETCHQSTVLCHLGAIAHRVGRDIKCDPATGHILDDAAAAALWSREYETGWEPKV